MDDKALRDELAHLSPQIRARLEHGGFDPERLVGWARELSSGGTSADAHNRLDAVSPPSADDVVELPAAGSDERARLEALGKASLDAGEVALLVLAGGMATRMGGVVKALVEALPGQTFLQLRLGERRHLTQSHGRPFSLWLMTSEATHGPIGEALSGEQLGDELSLFGQDVSLRLTKEGGLFRDPSGDPSVYPTGHGDLPDALRRSGLLERFIARGGKYVWIANLDNLGASVDRALLGSHIDRKATLSVEVVEKAGDKGGIPVRYHDKPVICEEFRLPQGFDAAQVRTFNTNTFLVDAAALSAYSAPFTYCVVEKQVGDRKVVQRERLLGEITFHLPTTFVKVPREGEASRFLPVKDREELAKRAQVIEAVARARGMLA